MNQNYLKLICLVVCNSALLSCDSRKSYESNSRVEHESKNATVNVNQSTIMPSADFSGVWTTKNGAHVIAECEFLKGKKHGKETLYYNSEGGHGDLMAVQHYKNGVKHGVSERYEMTTHVLLSRCEYRDGAIWSGAALDNGGMIDPENVLVQDLPYQVVIYKSGKVEKKGLSADFLK